MFSLCFQVRQETLNFVSLDLKRTDGKHEQDIINLKVCGRVNLCLLLCLKVLLDNFCFKATCVKSGTQHNQWLELLFRRLSTLAWNYCKMAQDRSTKHCVRAIQHQICTYQDERETSAIRAEQLHHSHNGFKVFLKLHLQSKEPKDMQTRLLNLRTT